MDQTRQLWMQVCASRGTPAPDPARLAGFIEDLGTPERDKLDSILALAARGREQPGDLGLLSWAASCMRPALVDQLQTYGLAFTSAKLFACALALRQEGWDMQMRLAQLASHPEDVAALRALLPAAKPVDPDEPQALAQAAPERLQDTAGDEAFYPWPDDDPDNGPIGSHAPATDPSDPSDSSAALPLLPTRFARQRPIAVEAFTGATKTEPLAGESRPRLRLFGKSAAHTLEITPHRRGGDFMGVQVLTIDSAHALSTGGGYDWAYKLVVQLTPEEMPGLIATLMGITPAVRFGHHGASHAKFIEARRQENGLVIVTGEKAISYSVPVPAGTAYYVLDLCCRAMAMNMGMEAGQPARSVSDVLMLVKSAHGF